VDERFLVTGAAGFVGSHLMSALRADGLDVIGTTLSNQQDDLIVMDLQDSEAVGRTVKEIAPTRIFHLAAQSSAALSWTDPALTFGVNVAGTYDLLEAIRRHCVDARVLVVASSDGYGYVGSHECPIVESAPLRPLSPYAVSKVACEAVAQMFHHAFDLSVIITRAFMHIGPGQPASFAIADWARQIARAEMGLEDPIVSVGNLGLVREFGDVRDVVFAYRMALEKGQPGEVYNVATGQGRTLKEVLGILMDLAAVDIQVHTDPRRIRPADPPLLVGSPAKLKRATGWSPQHKLRETLSEIIEHWRREVARQNQAGPGG
jgi:GDP-4-dehydro-6-deoxy-D-mannose reductase